MSNVECSHFIVFCVIKSWVYTPKESMLYFDIWMFILISGCTLTALYACEDSKEDDKSIWRRILIRYSPKLNGFYSPKFK